MTDEKAQQLAVKVISDATISREFQPIGDPAHFFRRLIKALKTIRAGITSDDAISLMLVIRNGGVDPIDDAIFFKALESEVYRSYENLIDPTTSQLDPIKPDVTAQFKLKIVASICSDIHLGTKSSRSEAFYRWLADQEERRIILLGDVLDLWIYSRTQKDIDLAGYVALEWIALWEALARARDRGCTIDFIPGNHDGFAYFVESCLSDDPWSISIVRKTPLLDAILSKTMKYRLVDVADIHYPFLKLNVGTNHILLTHGHFASLGWRLVNGLPDIEIPAWLTSISTVLAHKNARILRRFNNEKDWLLRTHRIEDTSIAITNALLSAYEEATSMLRNDPEGLVNLVDTAMALYFGGFVKISKTERERIREAFLFMRLDPRDHKQDLEDVRRQHRNLLGWRTDNVSLSKNGGSLVRTLLPFSAFQDFDTFAFGHFHDPRATEDIFDSGAYVDHVETSLEIREDGRFQRVQTHL
ncbi:Calcineurin-like phosphoesterase [Burkholderia sp. YR290]|nr:Calcineurin-like phosphoesterase [Burkholderia sp. YR290]